MPYATSVRVGKSNNVMSTKLETNESRVGKMNAVETVVCERFEQGEEPLRVIAADLSLPENQVVAVLAKFSEQFRAEMAPTEQEDGALGEATIGDTVIVGSQDDFNTLRSHAMSLATSAENESVQAKMTMYLLDEVKGRNDVRADSGSTQLNVMLNVISARNENTARLMAEQREVVSA